MLTVSIGQHVSVTTEKKHDNYVCVLSPGPASLVWCRTLIPSSLIGRSVMEFLRAVTVSLWLLAAFCSAPPPFGPLTHVLVSSARAPNLGAAYFLRCPGNKDRGGESPGWGCPLAEVALTLPRILSPIPTFPSLLPTLIISYNVGHCLLPAQDPYYTLLFSTC